MLESYTEKINPQKIAETGIPGYALAVAVLAFIIAAVTCSFDFETSGNIARKGQSALKPWLAYGNNEGGRNSMDQTIASLASGTSKDSLLLTNFYIQTANVTGILLPEAKPDTRSVVNMDAIRFAVLGGARAFVFDLWPDTEPGNGQHGPILLTMEPGSMWRRTSYNSVPFVTALSQLVYVAFQSGYKSSSNDVLIIYLRFRYPAGRAGPRVDTMDMTARTLQSAIQPYRLDAAFNRCRAQATIPMLPLGAFKQKVIVVSNTTGVGSSLVDYINISPQSGVPVEYEKGYAKSIIPTAAGGTMDAKNSAIATIKQNLSFVAPLGEDGEAFTNAWDAAGSQSLGVHCCAMNMNPVRLPAAVATQFAKDSFVLKPAELRYTPTVLPTPQQAPDFKFGSGASAGSIVTPSASTPF